MDFKHLIQYAKSLSGLAILLILVNCSTESARERMEAVKASAHPRAAAEGMDSFWLDSRSPPDRETQHWEFYYKHCTISERKQYMDAAEYMCTEPY